MKSIFINNVEYKVLKLLGHGKGGYSYLVEKDHRLFVVKQIHHEPCDYYQFGNKLDSEINDYQRLLKTDIKIPKLIDVDIDNERILKEYIDGPTIYELIKEEKMKKTYYEQIKIIADKVYKFGINIDYFLTNFIVNNDKLYYIDFECNNYMEQWNYENWGSKYWSKTKEFIDYWNKHKLL